MYSKTEQLCEWIVRTHVVDCSRREEEKNQSSCPHYNPKRVGERRRREHRTAWHYKHAHKSLIRHYMNIMTCICMQRPAFVQRCIFIH